METTQVLIIGAGPSGLALGISLAKYGIKSIILEKELEVPTDPRGVVLHGDAVRIAYDLGLGDDIPHLGQSMTEINFHKSTWVNAPFYHADLKPDWLQQNLSTGILMIQPKLERAMEKTATASELCDIRRGCIVENQQVLNDGIIINYQDKNGVARSIKCARLVGADGKKGIVRKHFLEKQAGIVQEAGIYPYEGTWIAANLHITPPTRETHPNLPFWGLGMTSEDVYDLYWPKGWHFCTPPGVPTAAGRFGKHEDRLWRHELVVENWNDSLDSEVLLWEHIMPLITRDRDDSGRRFSTGATMFPKDCITIRRCRPYTFANKVVNKWFAGRTTLIGDAAHVFPPFAGQGICSGVRDAHQLAWRLALILKCDVSDAVADDVLERWAKERRQGVDDAARMTEMNGKLVNEPESWAFYIIRNVEQALKNIPFVPQAVHPFSTLEALGYKPTTGGFFLADLQGGGKFPQLSVVSETGESVLSDKVLQRGDARTASLFAVISMQHGTIDPDRQNSEAKNLIRKSGIPRALLNDGAVMTFAMEPRTARTAASRADTHVFAPVAGSPSAASTAGWLSRARTAFDGRLPANTKFALVRPDFYIYAIADDLAQLEKALVGLRNHLGH